MNAAAWNAIAQLANIGTSALQGGLQIRKMNQDEAQRAEDVAFRQQQADTAERNFSAEQALKTRALSQEEKQFNRKQEIEDLKALPYRQAAKLYNRLDEIDDEYKGLENAKLRGWLPETNANLELIKLAQEQENINNALTGYTGSDIVSEDGAKIRRERGGVKSELTDLKGIITRLKGETDSKVYQAQALKELNDTGSISEPTARNAGMRGSVKLDDDGRKYIELQFQQYNDMGGYNPKDDGWGDTKIVRNPAEIKGLAQRWIQEAMKDTAEVRRRTQEYKLAGGKVDETDLGWMPSVMLNDKEANEIRKMDKAKRGPNKQYQLELSDAFNNGDVEAVSSIGLKKSSQEFNKGDEIIYSNLVQPSVTREVITPQPQALYPGRPSKIPLKTIEPAPTALIPRTSYIEDLNKKNAADIQALSNTPIAPIVVQSKAVNKPIVTPTGFIGIYNAAAQPVSDVKMQRTYPSETPYGKSIQAISTWYNKPRIQPVETAVEPEEYNVPLRGY